MINQIKELDDKYKITNEETNESIVKKILTFINQNPNFCPLLDKSAYGYIDDDLKSFIDGNNFKILDEFFFTRKKLPSSLKNRSWHGVHYHNTVLVVDKDKAKYIICKRSGGNYSIISQRLGRETLKKIYKYFVSDVINPSLILRELKDFEQEALSLNNKNVLYYNSKQSLSNSCDITYEQIYNISFDKFKRRVKYTTDTYTLNNKSLSFKLFSSGTYTTTIETFKNRLSRFNTKSAITKEQLIESIKEEYKKQVDMLSENLSNSFKEIENLKRFG